MIRNGKLASYWIRLSGLGYFIKMVIKQKSYVYPNFEVIKIHLQILVIQLSSKYLATLIIKVILFYKFYPSITEIKMFNGFSHI